MGSTDLHTKKLDQLEVGMSRTNVEASIGPQDATPMSRGFSRKLRRLSILPLALLACGVLAAPALAAEPTSGYTEKTSTTTTTTPTTTTTTTTPTTTTTTTTPGSGTSPAKEKTTPKETTPTPGKSVSPSTTKASTLPFTGFDLRWSLGIGLLLMGTGFSIVMAQRRGRRHGGR